MPKSMTSFFMSFYLTATLAARIGREKEAPSPTKGKISHGYIATLGETPLGVVTPWRVWPDDASQHPTTRNRIGIID